MIKLRTISLALLSVMATVMTATDYTVSGQYVTIPVKEVKEGGAQVVRLQVVNDNIIRVQATPEDRFSEKQSLIIVRQTQTPKFTVTDGDEVCEGCRRGGPCGQEYRWCHFL